MVITAQETQEFITWLIIFGTLYLIGRGFLELIFYKPKRPELLSSIEIAAALRNKKCGCGIFVACDKHSRQLDDMDIELKRKGE